MNQQTYHPYRSVLYMPGANARALEKARHLPCDAVILDLEDAVAPSEKEGARERITQELEKGGYAPRHTIVRINPLEGPWGRQDLAAFSATAPDAILVPKVNSAKDIQIAEQSLEAFGFPETTVLWAMMETPLGILNAADIASASHRLTCLVMGTNDLAKELHLDPGPDRAAFDTAFGLCLLAARAHGLVLLDGVYTDLEDIKGLKAECKQGAKRGFDGKTLIHPNQIDVANTIFSPDKQAVKKARQLVDAWEKAEANSQGVAVLDGKMIEKLHVEDARRILDLDRAIKALSKNK